jgi:hypothetical protein
MGEKKSKRVSTKSKIIRKHFETDLRKRQKVNYENINARIARLCSIPSPFWQSKSQKLHVGKQQHDENSFGKWENSLCIVWKLSFSHENDLCNVRQSVSPAGRCYDCETFHSCSKFCFPVMKIFRKIQISPASKRLLFWWKRKQLTKLSAQIRANKLIRTKHESTLSHRCGSFFKTPLKFPPFPPTVLKLIAIYFLMKIISF